MVSPYVGHFCIIFVSGNTLSNYFIVLWIEFLTYYKILTKSCDGHVQREIVRAQDLATAHYTENTQKDKQTGHGIWLAMHHAQQKTIKQLRGKNFDKFIAVANPKNGPEFFDEVLNNR